MNEKGNKARIDGIDMEQKDEICAQNHKKLENDIAGSVCVGVSGSWLDRLEGVDWRRKAWGLTLKSWEVFDRLGPSWR